MHRPGIYKVATTGTFLCKESTCNAGDLVSIPGLARPPGEEKGSLPQYSGLENSMDCIVHRVAKSQTRLTNFHFNFSTGTCVKQLWWQRQEGRCNRLRHTHLSGNPSQCPWKQGLWVGKGVAVVVPPLAHHSSMVPYFLGR